MSREDRPAAPAPADLAVPAKRGLPRGVYLLFATEMWERMSYYGMRALLVLYMKTATDHGGFGWSKEDALSVYGWYTAAVYLTPLFGGILADRLLGQRRAVLLGGFLMMIGHFLMAVPGVAAFYAALGFLVIGNGFFKPNISAMVGGLFKPGEPGRDSAYTVFYMGVNVGAALAPLVCGTLGEKIGFHWGFGSAGVGMLLGVIFFFFGAPRLLGDVGKAPRRGADAPKSDDEPPPKAVGPDRSGANGVVIGALWLVGALAVTALTFANARLTGSGKIVVATGALTFGLAQIARGVLAKRAASPAGRPEGATLPGAAARAAAPGQERREEVHRIAVISILALVNIVFWAAFEQAGGLMTLYTDEKVDRHILGWELPTTWFQLINPVFIVTLGPLASALWIALAKRGRDLDIPSKMSLGLFLMGSGFLFMMGAATESAARGKASLAWIVLAYLFHTIGELCVSPIGLSMVSKLAPKRMISLMMGVFFGSVAIGNKLAAEIGKYSEKLGEFTLFFAIVAATWAAAILVQAGSKPLVRWMHGRS